MSSHELKRLSKFLSFLLRHGADEFHLALDEQGFADFDKVWAIVQRRYRGKFSKEDLEPILAGELDGKKRLELVDGQIRAIYGHNRRVKQVAYEPAEPPAILYHGTHAHVIEKIQESGLLPMERQYVHLSVDQERAFTVARRYTRDPIMLEVRAQEAQAAGHVFFQPDNNHFLCEAIPAEFITFPS